MSENCPKCGTPVTDDLPGGLCPNCLMAAARKSQNEIAETAAAQPFFDAPSLSEMANRFPELEIIELIGQGGMGAVYKARQRELDRLVALKIFLYRTDDPEFAERFKREARALAKLSHPNIVTVYQSGSRDDLHFLMMEFVDGLNLRQITVDQRLAPAEAMQLVPQLCDALQYAHKAGVIHRDIKPENILLDSGGQIKIADFGLAKMTGTGKRGTLTHTRQVMGTLNYMAPEQIERPTEVDHRADIYSLGVVIYEMLTGELPLGRFQPPSEKVQVDVRLDEIVLRALEKEPDRRYQQASEFKTGFESIGNFAVDGHAVVHHAVPPAPPLKTASAYAPTRKSRLHVSIMGGREMKGNWDASNRNIVFTMMAGTCLDLTNVEATDVSINSFVMMGGVEVIVPTGAQVDVDGFILMGATTDNVHRDPHEKSPMKVRVRSYGLMGGLDVNSKKPKKAKTYRPVKQGDHEVTWQNGLVFLYRTFAMLVTLCVPLVFIMGGMDLLPEDVSNMYGIVAAITCGMVWAGLSYFRILVGARPDDATDEELAAFDSATKIGTLIRCVGLMLAFGCPILFVMGKYTDSDDSFKFFGIACAVLSFGVYSTAAYAEEYFYGKKVE